MTNDEIQARLAKAHERYDAITKPTKEEAITALQLMAMCRCVEALLAREAEVLAYALNNNMMLGSSSLLADLTAILDPQPAALAKEKTNDN